MHKQVLLTLIGGLFTAISFAQTTSSNPISSAGIGEFGSLPAGQFAGFGGVQSLSFDSTMLNTFNPSSYALLSHGQPLFGIGVGTKFSMYKSNSGNFNSYTTGITNFSLVVPFSKRFGIGAGLSPFTRKGYSFQNRSYAYNDSVTFDYTGSGATNYGFIGLGYAPIKNERTTLSIGAQFGFVFGSVNDQRMSIFDGTSTNSGIDITSYRVRSFTYNFGLSFKHFLDPERRKQLQFGVTYTPQVSLRTNLDYKLFVASDVTNYSTYDTLTLVENNEGKIIFPSRQTFALGYTFRPVNSDNAFGKIYSFGVYGEVDLMQWKNYQEQFTGHNSATFENTFMARVGIQFLPNADVQAKSKGIKYFSKIKYRLGGYYGSSPMSIGGKQVTTAAGTLGFAFPFFAQKSNSSINLSVQYGRSSTGVSGTFSENFFNFGLGIVIAPSSYERWFRKYKLD